ncbi:MAG: AIR synthase-related protein, partial [Acidimicrobiales bacterium]
EGGLGVALAEMAAASGVGARIAGLGDHRALFAEGPSRVLLSVPPAGADAVALRASASGVALAELGGAGGERLVVEGLLDLGVAELTDVRAGTLPAALGF